ncbi:MAG: Uma2 family endonuclease [Alphaproteobacteria bacterium]|nr:Uma2 family endonuclease [Alphaproteobacteria bacterium]
MSEPRPREWSLDEFLDWEARQAERWELADGQPVMMAGGTQAQALIAVNLLTMLRPLLRGTPCRPSGSDLRVPVPATGNCRYPDITIDCGEFRPDAHDVSMPVVVFEVSDRTKKLKDYDSIPSIRQYVCLFQDEPRVSVWLRGGDGRLVPQDDVTGLDASFTVVGIDQPLALAGIYEGSRFA